MNNLKNKREVNMPSEAQIRDKIEMHRDKISELQAQLPEKVSTRGDPVVEFHNREEY